jgi:hypothetical protein
MAYRFGEAFLFRSTQPLTTSCRLRAIPSAPAGTSSVMDDPAAT